MYFLIRGLDPVYKWNSIEFSIDFRELKNLGIMSLGWVFVFQTGYHIIMLCEFLVGFWETRSHSRTRDGCHVSTFKSRRDNFIGIRAVHFLNHRPFLQV